MKRLKQWLSERQKRKQKQRNHLIQTIAHQLYLHRTTRELQGDKATDLVRAQKLVRNPLTRTAFQLGIYWRNRIDAFESTWVEAALEGLVKDLQNLAIFDLLNIITSLSLIFTAVGFFSEADGRKRQRQNEAWQVISSSVGQVHEAGRVAAIEDLYADNVSLNSLDISHAYIRGLDLSPRCALLVWHVPAWFCRVHQKITVEQIAKLEIVNFQKVKMLDSDLQKARLWSSNFQGAYLRKNNLQEAELLQILLQESKLFANNLTGVNLSGGNLQKALLIGNNFQGANLSGSNLDRTFLIDMDLRTVTGLSREQLEGENAPLICNTSLPKQFDINKDRDCDRIAQALLKNFPKQEDGGGFASLEEAEEKLPRYREDAKSANKKKH